MKKKSLSALFQPVELTQGECWKTILAFSFPIIVSYLLQQVYTISDAAIVGQTLTAQEVAGVNDTTSLIFIFLQFAFGVSAGFCVVTSCNVGAHNPAGVRRSLTTQIVLSAALTVILTVLALLLLDPMLAWINVTPDNGEVYRAAYTYCAIIFAGIGAQLFYNFICSFLRSMGDSVTPLAFLLFSTVLNVGLDLLFIIVFRWGVAGAAIATVSAQLISTLGCFAYAFSKYPELRLHQEDWQITRHDVTRHLIQGIPLGLQFSVLAIGIIVVQSIVVQFDMLGGAMVSNAAQNGFGAANKVNNLNAGFKQVNGRAQFVELRSGTVNRHTFFFTDFAGFVNRTSQNVHDSAEGLRTNRNHNAVSESLNGHTALETFRRTHSNGSYYAVSKLLLHFKGQAFFSQLVVFVLFKNECVVNFGHFVARELDVHHRADDLYDLSDTHRYSSIRYLFN